MFSVRARGEHVYLSVNILRDYNKYFRIHTGLSLIFDKSGFLLFSSFYTKICIFCDDYNLKTTFFTFPDALIIINV